MEASATSVTSCQGCLLSTGVTADVDLEHLPEGVCVQLPQTVASAAPPPPQPALKESGLCSVSQGTSICTRHCILCRRALSSSPCMCLLNHLLPCIYVDIHSVLGTVISY